MLAEKQHDVSVDDVVVMGELDQKRVARSDRGKHAASGHSQAKLSPRPQHIRREFTLGGVRRRGRRSESHEFLRFVLQALEVGPILPQDSAVVTNTFSYRKDGFSYGFLITRGLEFFSDDLFISIRWNPYRENASVQRRLRCLDRASTRTDPSARLIALGREVNLRRSAHRDHGVIDDTPACSSGAGQANRGR
jgi:hypothetical protein